MQMKMPESIRELIAKAPFAHLTTLNSTGGPQVTVVWVGVEGEDFVIGHLHLPTYQKVKNIRRDQRVALSMLLRPANYSDIDRGLKPCQNVVIRGFELSLYYAGLNK
jgi:predicted pyridoxine 5'-phosphate oxidase superfamily flavin-nucleotide-binding protein